MPDKRVAYIDCDETLISWDPAAGDQSLLLNCDGFKRYVSPIKVHIELIKEFKAVGWQVVVWSQGGADHAERVIKLLCMEDYVDLIVSKPQVYVDDLAFENQNIRRVFKC